MNRGVYSPFNLANLGLMNRGVYNPFNLAIFRSDEQRSVKQKERKERELEHCSFNPERLEEQGAPLSMVSSFSFYNRQNGRTKCPKPECKCVTGVANLR